MTEEGIKIAIFQSPPVVYEDSPGNDRSRFMCIGNFWSLYLAKQLPASAKIRVNLIETPLKKNMDALALSLALSADSCHSLAPDKTSLYLESIRQYLKAHFPQIAMDLSPLFKGKKSFSEAFGINRRDL
ncbi:hypothetical protein DU506_01875 [Vreelandella rituensis]|uniref:Uncharacterized protein n=2 Tax=Vreelandella rituensis TaxID=2282306 RepID=A0A368U8W1_9GAMM|nr:hypothetical protein DU506_01875 [Halomonas rituensis]